MESLSNCLFSSSKYYRQAYANASKIAQPLGFNFLNIKHEARIQKRDGPLTRKILFDKFLIKVISNKQTPLQKLRQYLTVSDSKRKNNYLSASPLSLINRTNSDICEDLESKYMPQLGASVKQTIDYMNSLHNISKQVLYSIQDFALSNYFVFYDGANFNNAEHTFKLFEQQFLQYQVKFFSSQDLSKINPKFHHSQISPQQMSNRSSIDAYIKQTKNKAHQFDTMFSGFHFFVGDRIAQSITYDIIKQEIQNLTFLQYYVYVLSSGLLGNGQNAIIKLKGTIRHKTLDFLFLFKLMFSKLTLIKPAYSNYLSSQKYLICQGYSSQNGNQVHKYLYENFQFLSSYGQQKLLVNPQLIFRQQFLADSVKNFNDSLIVKGIKEVLDVYLSNNNLKIYPSKSGLIQKLKSNEEHGVVVERVVKEVEQLIPSEEEIKQQNSEENQSTIKNQKDGGFIPKGQIKEEIQEKEAGLDIFAFLKAKQQIKNPEKIIQKTQKPNTNQEEELEWQLDQRYKQQERIKQQKKKQKKEREKKEKEREKRNEDQFDGGVRFEYAQG